MTDFNIDESFIHALELSNKVNQSVYIPENTNTIRSKSINGTMFIQCDFSPEMPHDFSIYDLSEFLSVVRLIDSPKIEFTDNDSILYIKSANNKQKIRYLMYPTLSEEHIQKSPRLPSEEIEVDISPDVLTNVVKSSQLLKLPYIGFKSDKGRVLFSAFNLNGGDGNEQNSYSVDVGETSNEFCLYFKTEQLQTLMHNKENFTFTISKQKIAKAESNTATYYLALVTESSYE